MDKFVIWKSGEKYKHNRRKHNNVTNVLNVTINIKIRGKNLQKKRRKINILVEGMMIII